MGWAIALGILILLGCIPLGAELSYTAAGPRVRLVASFLRITLFPRPKKEKKKPKKDTSEQEKEETAKEEKPVKQTVPEGKKPKEKKGGSLRDFLPFVKDGIDFLGDFRRKLRVNNLDLTFVMGGADPADLAVNYGRICAAVAALEPQLDRVFVIKKKNIRIECDFTQEDSTVLLNMAVTITLGRILRLLTKYGWRVGKHLLELKKKQKSIVNEKDGK